MHGPIVPLMCSKLSITVNDCTMLQKMLCMHAKTSSILHVILGWM